MHIIMWYIKFACIFCIDQCINSPIYQYKYPVKAKTNIACVNAIKNLYIAKNTHWTKISTNQSVLFMEEKARKIGKEDR